MGQTSEKVVFKTVHYVDGEKYEGEIKNKKRSGYGINYYPNGNKFEGWWENDLKMELGDFF